MSSPNNLAGLVVGAAAAAVLAYAWRKKRADKGAWEKHTCRLPKRTTADDKKEILQNVTLEDRTAFFELSCCPVTSEVEQRMEQISSIASKEHYTDHWDVGVYRCARCSNVLYNSESKFVGPCLWPSFRAPHAADSSLHTIEVPKGAYNEYTCAVHELYCKQCRLFLGHQFEDGASTGDTHPQARWRHCVLSLSLVFAWDPLVLALP